MSTTVGGEAGRVYVLDEPGAIRKKFGSAVTDSGREIVRTPDKAGVSNLIEIAAAVTSTAPEEVEKRFEGAGYGDLKKTVAEDVVAYLEPVREPTAKSW